MASILHDLAREHLFSAVHFSNLAGALESDPANKVKENSLEQQRAYVVACVLACGAFLESKVNRLYFDAAEWVREVAGEPPPERFGSSASSLVPKLAAAWSLERFERDPSLGKWDFASQLAGLGPLDRGRAPFQDVQLVVDLRNHLVHPKPEWIRVGGATPPAPHAFEDKLRGRFSLNCLVDDYEPFFPDRALGHGCAQWAVESCVAFAEEFFDRLGVPLGYADLRGALR
jgi:hypothetical protein